MLQHEYARKALAWFDTALRYDNNQYKIKDEETRVRILILALQKACDFERMSLGFPAIYYPLDITATRQPDPIAFKGNVDAWDDGKYATRIEYKPVIMLVDKSHEPKEIILSRKGRVALLPM